MTAIQQYVRDHWDTLPKSTFNDEEVVVVRTFDNDDWGYSHHNYSAVALTREGKPYWAFSSGCSCGGSCGLTHENTMKVLPTDPDSMGLDALDPATIDFAGQQVSFSDY